MTLYDDELHHLLDELTFVDSYIEGLNRKELNSAKNKVEGALMEVYDIIVSREGEVA